MHRRWKFFGSQNTDDDDDYIGSGFSFSFLFDPSKMVEHTYEMLMLWGTAERGGKKWIRKNVGDGKNSKIHAVNALILYE